MIDFGIARYHDRDAQATATGLVTLAKNATSALRMPDLPSFATTSAPTPAAVPSVPPAEVTEVTEVTRLRAKKQPPKSRSRAAKVAALSGVLLLGAVLFVASSSQSFSAHSTALNAETHLTGAQGALGHGPALPRVPVTDLSTLRLLSPGGNKAPSLGEPTPAVHPHGASQQEEDLPAPRATPNETSASLTGDLLIVSGNPDATARVYLGERLLGVTPVRTRLPAGTVTLRVQPTGEGAPALLQARVEPGRVNILTVGGRSIP